MDWAKEIGGMLNTYEAANPQAAPASVHDDFDKVAAKAPPAEVADGLAAAFRSDHTPPFGDMLGQLFGQSSGPQRAGILNQLLATVGPGVAAAILGRALGPRAPQDLGQATPRVDDATAAQVPPGAVAEIAAEAEKKDPSIVDRISHAYAQQPQIVKTLGKVALTVALAQMAKKQWAAR